MKTKFYLLTLLVLLCTISCTEVDSLTEQDLINNTQSIEDGEITDDDI